MAYLSLRISMPDRRTVKMMQFEPSMSAQSACELIREKLAEVSSGFIEPRQDYGLFLPDEDSRKGVWLESGRSLSYYLLRDGDLLELRRKQRQLKVRLLDGSLKTILVDDSQPLANLMVVICSKIGITNHDEYSLVRCEQPDETDAQRNNPSFGTLTLRRKREERRERDAKMDQLRKKLRTEEDVNWLDPSKTFREQGIDEHETLLLRRKFYFSDQNIDSRDPVQLNLLYVQTRDAILDGTHPVTQEQACLFAGIQCQVQFGDYNENKHRIGFLDLKEFLPQSYVKSKAIEKQVFAEHKRCNGLSELDAKLLYTKTARSLKTYGITFFLVKEKMEGKNKLVPRLLGVTKDSVLRIDEKSKEILKSWPLTSIRRWGPSPKTFTLDFGDYSDQYYSVQTSEAEQIGQLISDYIDIILRRQKAKEHFGIEGDEGSAMLEDSVAPHKATYLQHELVERRDVEPLALEQPAALRADLEELYEERRFLSMMTEQTTLTEHVDYVAQPEYAGSIVEQYEKMESNELSESQHELADACAGGQEAIEIAERELSRRDSPPIETTSKRWVEETVAMTRQNLSEQISTMNEAAAKVVTLTSASEDFVDRQAVSEAIHTISATLPEMTRDVKMMASLLADEAAGDDLLEAARKLCAAFSDLLRSVEPTSSSGASLDFEEDRAISRQTLLDAAFRVGEASCHLLKNIGAEKSVHYVQDTLLSLAKAVANTTAVLRAKNVMASGGFRDSMAHNQFLADVTERAHSRVAGY